MEICAISPIVPLIRLMAATDSYRLAVKETVVSGVRCYAIAASRQQRASSRTRIRDDGLVAVNSALGVRRDPSLGLAFPENRRWIGYGMGHFDLLSNHAVYDQIRRWLADGQESG